MRTQIKSNLEKSASLYADHAENKVLKLQHAYLSEYQSQQYAYSANVLPRPQASEPFDEGGANVIYEFQLGL